MNKNTKITLATLIVIIIVILGVISYLTIFQDEKFKFYGTWQEEIEEDYYIQELMFYDNGSFKQVTTFDLEGDELDSIEIMNGTWYLEEKKLVLNYYVIGYGNTTLIHDYKFSDNDQTLTITLTTEEGTASSILHKK